MPTFSVDEIACKNTNTHTHGHTLVRTHQNTSLCSLSALNEVLFLSRCWGQKKMLPPWFFSFCFLSRHVGAVLPSICYSFLQFVGMALHELCFSFGC